MASLGPPVRGRPSELIQDKRGRQLRRLLLTAGGERRLLARPPPLLGRPLPQVGDGGAHIVGHGHILEDTLAPPRHRRPLASLAVVAVEPGITITASRTTSHDIRRHKAFHCPQERRR